MVKHSEDTCPYCGKGFNSTENVILCQTCFALYHKQCIEKAGGCVVQNCPACKGTPAHKEETVSPREVTENKITLQDIKNKRILCECGFICEPTHKFCPECGADTGKNTSSAKRKARRRKRILRRLFTLLLVLIITGGLTATAIFYVIPMVKYSSAEKVLESGDYDSAKELFTALGSFKDSETMVKEALYRKGTEYKKEKNYVDAVVIFAGIRDYKDSEELEKFCFGEDIFARGKAAYEEKNYRDASSYFDQITDIREDAVKWAQKAHYAYAQRLYKKEKYDLASEHYEAAGDYKQAREKADETNYTYGMLCFEQKYFRLAYEYLSKVKDYNDVPEIYNEVTYQYGNWLVRHNSGHMAIEIFTSLGDYKKSREHINEIKYNYVLENPDSSNEKTYKYLMQLKAENYEDSALIYKELFSWKISLVAANKEKDDFTSVDEKINGNCDYFHMEFLLSDGPADGTIDLSHVIEYPDGTSSNGSFIWEKQRSGDTFGLVFTDGIYEKDEKKTAGTMKIKIYNNDDGTLISVFEIKVSKD